MIIAESIKQNLFTMTFNGVSEDAKKFNRHG